MRNQLCIALTLYYSRDTMTNFMIVVMVVALVSSAANAFGPMPMVRFSTRTSGRSSMSPLFYTPRHMDRAIECATHYGTCQIDELENLTNGMYSTIYTASYEAEDISCVIHSFLLYPRRSKNNDTWIHINKYRKMACGVTFGCIV
jgi:hypothetical protein